MHDSDAQYTASSCYSSIAQYDLFHHQNHQQYSSMTSRAGVALEVSMWLQIWRMILPFNKKKNHCLTRVTKQFYRFHLHRSAFPPPSHTHISPDKPSRWACALIHDRFPSLLRFHSFIHSLTDMLVSWAISVHQIYSQIRTLGWPTGKRQVIHPLCQTWICHRKHWLAGFSTEALHFPLFKLCDTCETGQNKNAKRENVENVLKWMEQMGFFCETFLGSQLLKHKAVW